MERYDKIIRAIREYFGERKANQLFLHGGCYVLSDYLIKQIPDAQMMINRQEEHCATLIDKKLYDISGMISKHNFRYATQRDIAFMKKNYIPQFNVREIIQYLNQNIS